MKRQRKHRQAGRRDTRFLLFSYPGGVCFSRGVLQVLLSSRRQIWDETATRAPTQRCVVHHTCIRAVYGIRMYTYVYVRSCGICKASLVQGGTFLFRKELPVDEAISCLPLSALA